MEMNENFANEIVCNFVVEDIRNLISLIEMMMAMTNDREEKILYMKLTMKLRAITKEIRFHKINKTEQSDGEEIRK